MYNKGDISSKKCTSPESFKTENLIFGETKEGELKDGSVFRKTPISVRHPDGSVGPLIIISKPCFSFGIQKDSRYGGYSIPLVLLDKEEPTDEQRKFTKVIKKILSECDPRPKSCMYGKEKSNPIMYVKIDYNKECDEFYTKFYERKDMDDKKSTKEIKPEKYVGKKQCLAKVAIKIDNLFKAKTTTLQMRAHTIIFSEAKIVRPDKSVSVLDEM